MIPRGGSASYFERVNVSYESSTPPPRLPAMEQLRRRQLTDSLARVRSFANLARDSRPGAAIATLWRRGGRGGRGGGRMSRFAGFDL